MKKQTLIDESVLDGIPDELIRPLLAISIRASHPHTRKGYQQLLADVRRLAAPCHTAGGESLYYIDVETRVQQYIHAMRAAEKWARQPDAEATSIETDQWAVEVHSQGQNRSLLVSYERAGVDPRNFEERVRLVVTETPPRQRQDLE